MRVEMSTSGIALQADRLWKQFNGRDILRGVDLKVPEGECVLLTGTNGAGKTTLLGCLSGLVRPSKGRVWVSGRDATDPRARQGLGVASHESLLYPHLTVRENLLLAARMYGVAGPVCRMNDLLGDVGMSAYGHCFPSQLSQGMRRRVSIGRALVHDPPILLLDEPFSALDEDGRQWVSALLRDRRSRGMTTVASAQEADLQAVSADRVLVVHSGRLSVAAPGKRLES